MRATCATARSLDAGYVPAGSRARVQLETHRYEAALDDFARVIDATPRDKLAHFHKANVLRALRQHDAARQAYADAIEIDPDYVLAHCIMRSCACRSAISKRVGRSMNGVGAIRSSMRAGARSRSRAGHGMPLDGKTILLYPEQPATRCSSAAMSRS